MADLTLTAFVKQLAIRLTDEHVPMPLRNQRPWHMFLYELKRAPIAGKPAFLANLWFDWDGPTPEAPELSELLARLHWSASVSAANPQYDTLSLPDQIAQLWRAQAPNIDHDEEQFLSTATQRAKEVFATAMQQPAR